ncbi:hypothetical protein [uncultured Abiotrophia sp.]|jgi:hypothetical protein|uniref:hypothetical protein n=1 Tax=uncultured Abiotrophia sp. TaxID=316094 RepID=UPI00288B707E|nr:hypothetical protein [uncultured Abiotrophia sp.]
MVVFDELYDAHRARLATLETEEDQLKEKYRKRLNDLDEWKCEILKLYGKEGIPISNSKALKYIEQLWDETERIYRNNQQIIVEAKEKEIQSFKNQIGEERGR